MIRQHTDGGVTTLTIDAPATRNAFTAQMVNDLIDAIAASGDDDDVKAVVVRGEGRHFSSGFDVTDPRDFEGAPGDSRRSRLAAITEKSDWMRRILDAPKPLVVAVRGSCIGIATYLAVLADFTVVAADASLGLPEERFGSAGATWIYPFLIREIGIKRATEMVMTGRRYSGQEMADLGLVTRAVDSDALGDTVGQLTKALCSLPREGIAINRTIKRLSLDAIGHTSSFGFHAAVHPLAEQMRREDDEFNFMGYAAEHGMKAAIEERNRRFAGDWWGW